MRKALCIVALLVLAMMAAAAAPVSYSLRGYGRLQVEEPATAAAATSPAVFRVTCADPAHARVFASKLLSDYQVLGRNRATTVTVAGGRVPAVQAPEGWVLAALAREGSATVVVVCAASPASAVAALTPLVIGPGRVLAAADLTHPLYLDKWDRDCFGSWHRHNNVGDDKVHLGPDGKPSAEAYYSYVQSLGIGLQGADFFTCADGVASGVGFDGIRRYLDEHKIPFQYASWLTADYDLYNRDPLLAAHWQEGFSPVHSYYGEVPHVPSLLEDQQNATWLETLKQAEADPNFLAILEPHGEIGPFEADWFAQQSEPGRQDFIRFLRDERHYDLATLATRWFGKPDALQQWKEVSFPDAKTFYGYTPGSQLFRGEWATHSDPTRAGEAGGWAAPGWDDATWRRLRLPGDQTVNFAKGYTWYRFRFDVAPNLRSAAKLYLSVVSFNHGFGDKPGVVYVNGQKIGEIRMRDWYHQDNGWFEATAALKPAGNVLALLLPDGPLPGPVFLTPQPVEDFPTSDPQLNARKADYQDWVTYTIGTAMRRTCSYIRSVDPDRAIKFHAVESEWADRAMQDYGGYGHCTGEGAFYRPFFKRFGFPRGSQASAEPGGSPADLPGLKNLFWCIWMEGLNAFDFFYRLPDVINAPQQKAYFEQMLPYMKLMGSHNLKDPQVALLFSRRSARFQGPWMDATRFDFNGAVMGLHRSFVYLDEAAIMDGLAPKYPLLLDNGTECWDPALSAQLEAYVRAGGTLALVSNSGRHTFTQRNAWPVAALAGCTVTGERKPGGTWGMEAAPAAFVPLAGKSWPVWERRYCAYPLVAAGPEAQVLGRFKEDNAPALIRRPLGKGQVIWAVAAAGFNNDVLGQLFAEANCPANSTGNLWTESFRSNDGCEEMLMVGGDGQKDLPMNTSWRPGFTPRAVFDPVTGETVPATITEGDVKLPEITLPVRELRFVSARRPVTAEQAFRHWLQRQGEIWSGVGPVVKPPTIVPFRDLDLSREWQMAAFDTPAELEAFGALPVAAQEKQLKPTALVTWQDAGLPTGVDRRADYRRTFTVTAGWLRNSRQDLVLVGQWPRNGLPGKGELWINGKKVADLASVPSQGRTVEVTAALRPGENTLDVVAGATATDGGFAAEVFLRRTVNPRQVISLAGNWQAQVSEDQLSRAPLPGKFEGAYVYTDYTLPANLAGKQIWIVVDSVDSNSASWIATNGRVRYLSYFGSRSEQGRALQLDITPDLRPGESNRIQIGTQRTANGDWKPGSHEYRDISLWVYEPGDWEVKG
ncbi:MAG TPA: hypothetical protein VGM19_03320 [Armatimonadota bacterium]|jgi:hypothetical protein